MYKIAATTSVVSMAVAASVFRTVETPGLFAIAWIGGLAFAAAVAFSKSYMPRS